jgi:hypothetical protein
VGPFPDELLRCLEVLSMTSDEAVVVTQAMDAAIVRREQAAAGGRAGAAQVCARTIQQSGLTREVETPLLPSNSPHDHMVLRVDLVGSPQAARTPLPASLDSLRPRAWGMLVQLLEAKVHALELVSGTAESDAVLLTEKLPRNAHACIVYRLAQKQLARQYLQLAVQHRDACKA